SNGSNGSIHLTTSGASINTAGASINPAAITSTSHAAFCAVATHSVTVKKALSPPADTGLFDLQINGSTVSGASGVGDAGSGSNSSVAVGSTVSIAELGHGTTSLSNYTTTAITCDGVTAPSGTTSGSFTMPDGDVTCTFHNTRKTHSVTVK